MRPGGDLGRGAGPGPPPTAKLPCPDLPSSGEEGPRISSFALRSEDTLQNPEDRNEVAVSPSLAPWGMLAPFGEQLPGGRS